MSEQPAQPSPETPAPMTEVSAPAATPNTPVMQNPAPKSGGSKGLILIILALLIVIAGGVGAFVVIQNNNKSQKSDAEMSKDKDKKSDEKKMAADEEKEEGKNEKERDASRKKIEDLEDLLRNVTNEEDAKNQMDGFLDEVYKTVDLPSDFPSDAPVFDESGVYSVDESKESFEVQMKYDPKKVSLDDVYDFYIKALKKEDWEIGVKSKTSDSFSITASKDDDKREINVNGSEIIDIFVILEVSK